MVDAIPKTRFVSVGSADVAYQVLGDGPVDLVFSNGGGGHVDLDWDSPSFGAGLRRLASFSRLIRFDHRGVGASDAAPSDSNWTWEQWVEDLEAVLNVTASSRAALFAILDAGPIAVLFAATRPTRISALILGNTTARFLRAPGYDIGVSDQQAEQQIRGVAAAWGTPEFMHATNPGIDRESALRMARAQRAAMTPRTAAARYRYMWWNMDVREILPSIQVPTLVLHGKDLSSIPITHGRFLAERIPGAVYAPFDGASAGIFVDQPDFIIDEVAQFLTGEAAPTDMNKVLTTVLVTDIVGATDQLAAVGDHRWRGLLDAHDSAVRAQIQRWRGREINTTGDGFVASFDGPARAIRCARAVGGSVEHLGISVRAGVHTGECVVRGEDLGGIAVHIAARISALAGPNEVLVSSTVRDLVAGSGIEFEGRGERKLKGVPNAWNIFAVTA